MSSQSKRIALTVRVPNATYHILHAIAERRGMPLNAVANGLFYDLVRDELPPLDAAEVLKQAGIIIAAE